MLSTDGSNGQRNQREIASHSTQRSRLMTIEISILPKDIKLIIKVVVFTP